MTVCFQPSFSDFMVGFGYVEVVVAHSGDVVAVFGAIAELRRKNDWPGIFYRCGALMSWAFGGDSLLSRQLNLPKRLFSF